MSCTVPASDVSRSVCREVQAQHGHQTIGLEADGGLLPPGPEFQGRTKMQHPLLGEVVALLAKERPRESETCTKC